MDRCFYKKTPHAKLEASMLKELGHYISCVKVLEYDEHSLSLQKLPYHGVYDEVEFAEALALMHQNRFEFYGYGRDTTIGSFVQPNPKESDWGEFFAKHRIGYMAKKCLQEGRIEEKMFDRVLRFSEDVSNNLTSSHPSILHGDLWGGNVMNDGRKTILIDPAIYYGSYEYDIAFSTLFGTFSKRFYDAYSSYNPLDSEFWKSRVDMLNSYALLVHIRAFGGGYVNQLDSVLRKFGR
ncbi:MAG: fructosamine kinase family protein [Campylobacterales bacterium]